MEFSEFWRDSTALEDGMWIGGEDLPALKNVRLKVRGTDSDVYAFASSRLQIAAPVEDREQDGQIKPEAFVRIRSRLLGEVVLLDWSGITENGTEVPFSRELAVERCSDPNYRGFADVILYAAGVVNRKVRERTEQVSGN